MIAAVRKIWLVCLVMMSLILSVAGGNAQQTTPGAAIHFTTEVPLLDCEGTPCVEARIGDGKAMKFVLDTGDAESVVDSLVSEGAGLKQVGTMPAGAPAGMFRTEIAAMHVGGATLSRVHALSMGLHEMITQKQMPDVAGSLAYTAFGERAVQLDFVNHKLRISEPLTQTAACPGPCSKFSLITFGKHGPPVLIAQDFEVAGNKVTAQVDSMYTGSMLVYTASIEKLGLGEIAKTDKTRFFNFTDGGVTMKEAPSQKQTFQGTAIGSSSPLIYFPTEGVHEPDGMFDATVGLELFYGAVVTLDFFDKTITVQKP